MFLLGYVKGEFSFGKDSFNRSSQNRTIDCNLWAGQLLYNKGNKTTTLTLPTDKKAGFCSRQHESESTTKEKPRPFDNPSLPERKAG